MLYLIHQTIDRIADQAPEREAFRCRDESICYGELSQRTNQLAHLLVSLGVKPGHRVGIRLPKSIASPIAVHGVMKCGAVFVPLDPLLPAGGLGQSIADCGLRIVVTDRPLPLMSNVELDAVVRVDSGAGPGTPIVAWSDLDSFSGDNAPQVSLTEHDLAYIMYTSGSTGRPKGIMHTHRSGLSYAELSVATYGVHSEDRIANHSPLHFDMSTFGYFSGPLAGATTVLIPEEYAKLPASLSQLVQREQITIWYSVPSALIQLLDRGVLESRDLSTLRWVKFGGEPFSTKHLQRLMEHWPQARFSNVYGPAEVNQCTWYHVPANDEALRAGTIPIGTTWENTEGRVVDPNGDSVEIGDVGELVVRSATMMRGYWNQPELTDKSLYRVREQGVEKAFYRTGDLVRLLEDGGYLFVGRRDRQIKTRGHRVELDDVEAVLNSCVGVLEAAAFPVDDGEGSRVIEAAVVVKGDSAVSSTRLLQEARGRLPAYAVPRRLYTVAEFPRTATGKIDRRELQRIAQEGMLEEVATSEEVIRSEEVTRRV